MKKKIFLSGVNAKLALAAVALTSVMFTSCEKEEFNVAPVELDPASATVAITVYDLSDGSIINGASITENGAAITSNPFVIEAGSDGKIAAATRTFAATKDEYLSGEGQATVPALNKGQFALIPVSIFLQQELNAAEDVVVDQDEETITPSEVGGEQKGGENTSSKEKEMDLPYTAKVGQEVTNIAAVNASIDAMPITRGLSDDEVKKVLKALVKSYSPGITDVTYTKKVTVPAYTIVTLKTTTEYETSDNTISTVVDGKLYTIPNVKIKKVVKTVVDPVFTSTEHGHGHGHGNGNNAGGGDGAADGGGGVSAGAAHRAASPGRDRGADDPGRGRGEPHRPVVPGLCGGHVRPDSIFLSGVQLCRLLRGGGGHYPAGGERQMFDCTPQILIICRDSIRRGAHCTPAA